VWRGVRLVEIRLVPIYAAHQQATEPDYAEQNRQKDSLGVARSAGRFEKRLYRLNALWLRPAPTNPNETLLSLSCVEIPHFGASTTIPARFIVEAGFNEGTAGTMETESGLNSALGESGEKIGDPWRLCLSH